MTITFSQIVALNPCWNKFELQVHLPADDTPVELTLDGLLSLHFSDARWLVISLMNKDKLKLVAWAKGCADRAAEYARQEAKAFGKAGEARLQAADSFASYETCQWAASRMNLCDTRAALGASRYARNAACEIGKSHEEHTKAMVHALQLLNS